MKKYLVATFVLGMSFSFLPYLSAAEEAKQPAAQEQVAPAVPEAAPAGQAADETEFSYGTVKSIAADQIVVSEYDYDTDKDVDVTYSVPAGTTFENVASLQEIKAGDAVDIDYTLKDGKKVASSVTVEKPIAEGEEDVALDTGADQGEPEAGKPA